MHKIRKESVMAIVFEVFCYSSQIKKRHSQLNLGLVFILAAKRRKLII